MLGTGHSIWQGVRHQHCGPTYVSIWGSGPCRSNLTLPPLCVPVGSFPDTSPCVSGPAVTGTPQIQPCSPLILA